MAVHVGFAEFDALGVSVSVGWCEFDATASTKHCVVGWCEFDCLSPTTEPVPPYEPGGGTSRYHSRTRKKYVIPVDVDESEEERIVMSILLEIAQNEIG